MRKVTNLVIGLVLMMVFLLNSYNAKGEVGKAVNASTGSLKSNVVSTNPTDYLPNTKERYIASIARQKRVTFEEAKKTNDAEEALLLKNMPADEEIRYKTINKHAGDIKSSKKIFSVNMTAEVRYAWSNTYGKPVQIHNITHITIFIPDVSISTIVGGGPNIEQTLTKVRASQTAVVAYSVSSSLGITADHDILNIIATSGGMMHLITKAKTYSINIGLADLY